jgi:hypothetical protein
MRCEQAQGKAVDEMHFSSVPIISRGAAKKKMFSPCQMI